MTQEDWLTSHPYLHPVADLHAQINVATAEFRSSKIGVVRWDTYLNDFLTGVPLLHNTAAPFDFGPAEKATRLLVERLASQPLSEKLASQLQILQAELRFRSESSRSVIRWLFDEGLFDTSCAGLLRYLGWTVMADYLDPLVNAFDTWREGERWLCTYCPTCGSLPAMAQLAGSDPARTRFLSCGCCRTRWQYRRLGCPFCGNQEDRRLGILMFEAEGALRIDYCERCKGYLKTYCGLGDEKVLLADWTSVHLDVIARDRGFNRLAMSLYES